MSPSSSRRARFRGRPSSLSSSLQTTSVKLHKPRSLWNLYGIRLECLLESPFYRPVPYIFARHFQNFFAFFRISEKNIFLGISSSSSFFEKLKIEIKKSHTQSACGIKLYSFSHVACGGAFHPGAVRVQGSHHSHP